jgi:hypothetical protein
MKDSKSLVVSSLTFSEFLDEQIQQKTKKFYEEMKSNL